MGVGLSDYKFGRKNNWRRWSWNRCIEKLSVNPPRDAVCLYLPSEQNIDEQVAVSKGFKKINLFGIENDKKIFKHLRKQKINIINGDLKDVISSWGDNPKIDIIHADFCNGLVKDNHKFISSLFSCKAVSTRTIVAVNLLRGRDEHSNFVRDWLIQFDSKSFEKKITWEKHRGFQFVVLLLMWDSHLYREKEFIEWALYWDWMRPSFFSYRSITKTKKRKTVQVFDSVVFKMPPINYSFYRDIVQKDSSLSRKIAAVKAIQTMRCRGNIL